MFTGRLVFSQLMDFLPRHEFNQCVRRYKGNYRVRKFSCLDQFLCMAFARLTFQDGLRGIEARLRAMQPKLYHIRWSPHQPCPASIPDRRGQMRYLFKQPVNGNIFPCPGPPPPATALGSDRTELNGLAETSTSTSSTAKFPPFRRTSQRKT